jgi:hypothetical protein
MVGVVRPLLRRLFPPDITLTGDRFALIVILLLASVWATETLEIHALFGTFLAGLVVPKNHRLGSALKQRAESVTLALFLPLFFVYNGLRTSVALINGMDLWLMCGIIIAVATVSKHCLVHPRRWPHVARVPGGGRVGECARTGGTGHPECRVRPADHFTRRFLNDGDHGPDHHFYDAAADHLDPPRSVRIMESA